MKRSEMQITMPLTTFDELNSYKDKYENLVNSIKNCFDTSHVETNISNNITLNLNDVFNIWKNVRGIKYKNCEIILQKD